MRERPILFSAPMVRAILAGSKTQTRRVVTDNEGPNLASEIQEHRELLGKPYCRYGDVGDRLWVRETWQGPLWPDDDPLPENGYQPRYCEYRADGGPTPYYVDADDNVREGWRPSIHMPRWASRILLEIVSVRVERLQEISDADAEAEGIETVQVSETDFRYVDYLRRTDRALSEKEATRGSPVMSYATLWESLNGPGSWSANPRVWVVEFRRIDA